MVLIKYVWNTIWGSGGYHGFGSDLDWMVLRWSRICISELCRPIAFSRFWFVRSSVHIYGHFLPEICDIPEFLIRFPSHIMLSPWLYCFELRPMTEKPKSPSPLRSNVLPFLSFYVTWHRPKAPFLTQQ